MKIDLYLSEEQRMMRDVARRFATQEVAGKAAEIDRSDVFPADLYRRMGEIGLLGLLLPHEFGGSGSDTLTHAVVHEELAQASATVANSQVLAIEEGMTLLDHASKVIQEKYLPGVVAGSIIPAFALTEPGAGSDASGIKTRAERDGDDFVITGSKSYITAGALADFVIVIAVTDPGAGTRGMSAFVVDRDTAGFSVGRHEDLHGVRGLGTAQLHFDHCRVPASNMIGEEGNGLRMGFTTIDLGRISTAAMAVGIAQAAFNAAFAYARERKQFNQPIFDFQAVQFKLADMATQIDAARLLYVHAAQLRDKGMKFSREASEAKMFASDISSKVADEAMLIFGGNGYSREYPAERYVRDARLCQIFEGTNNIQHIVIARQLVKESAT